MYSAFLFDSRESPNFLFAMSSLSDRHLSALINEDTDKIFGKVYFEMFLICRLFQTKPGTMKMQ